jgi:FtsP/CotA-like multicopper oxidase with cupredoxin domain
MTVTHADGFPVQQLDTECLLIGMGERYDVSVTLDDGVFPFVAAAEGKGALARALIRTGAGSPPESGYLPRELTGRLVQVPDLSPRDDVRLPTRTADRELRLRLTGGMHGYAWAIDGAGVNHDDALTIRQDERVRLILTNTSMMWHPMHVHGHTFAVAPGGVRKDTVAVLPMQTVVCEFDANNPGQWMIHCHNAYHLEAGMMRTFAYTR